MFRASLEGAWLSGMLSNGMRNTRRLALPLPFGVVLLAVAALHCGLDVRGTAEPLPTGPSSSVAVTSSAGGDASNDSEAKQDSGHDAEPSRTPDGAPPKSDAGCAPFGGTCVTTDDCCSGSCDDDNGSFSCQE